MDKLIAETPFDLPADLVARQEKTTIRRLVMELRQGGLSDTEIRAREAEIRANAHETTLRSLKEFFVLAKIAEAEEIKVEDEDIDDGDRGDRRPDRREPAPGPRPDREGRAGRRPGLPDPRAQDDRPDPRVRQVRGSPARRGTGGRDARPDGDRRPTHGRSRAPTQRSRPSRPHRARARSG